MKRTTPILCAVLAAFAVSASADERDIQITSVAPQDAVIQLTNLGLDPIPLDGFRFCTQSTTQVLRYTSSTGLNGVTLNPNDSIYIHQNNDAPADPAHMNASDLGGVFATMDLEAYAISFYFPIDGSLNFNNPANMADHMQFSRMGLNNFTADERTDEAVAAGLWTALTDWIPIETDTELIELVDLSNGRLHGPGDYIVTGPFVCVADFTNDGVLDVFDVFAFLDAFNAGDPSADLNSSGNLDIFDVFAFLDLFNAGCP
ncbi:MAG: hypothetical protein KC996_01185 [Phycisphaerales bacterium]|nr:hypothetical protein [Phycisphaerales bacterium]